MAAGTGREPEDLIRDAIAMLLLDDESFQAQVKIGVDQIARGEFIEEDEMDSRVERMLSSAR